MIFLKEIKNPTLIICSYQNKIILLNKLNELNSLVKVNFLTLQELFEKCYFSYDERAIYKVTTDLKLKVDVAKNQLNYLIYLENNTFDNPKLNSLASLKEELEKLDLLEKDSYFYDYIKSKNIIFYGFDYIDNFTNKLIAKLKTITNVEIINKKYFNYQHEAVEFKHIEEEVEYVATKICELINNNVDINKIKLTNIDDEYIPILERVFAIYNIPININNSSTLFNTLACREFINNYSSDLESILDSLKNRYNNDILNQMINIINKYSFVEDKLKVKDLIVYDFANTKLKKSKLKNAIEIINYDEIIDDSNYVFMLNFNLNKIPKIIKDEKCLNDKELSFLGLETSSNLNKIFLENAKKNIKSIKNLTITYKLESYQNTYYPSALIENMNLNVVEKNIDLIYSNLANKINLCRDLDKYFKYNIKSDELVELYNNYKIPYRKYRNTFNGITKEELNKITKNKFSLSYSSLQIYNECAFKYYINNVLKLDPFEDTFSAFIGTLFHHILEIGIKKEIDVKEEVKLFISDKQLNSKEQFFVDKLISDIEFALNTIKEQLQLSKFKDIKTENKYEVVKKKDNVIVTFKGFIDKMMSFSNDSKTYVALVDYKTYDTDVKIDLLEYGLNIQLPIYLYLANSNLENIEFAGFYVQKILSNENKYDFSKTLESSKKEKMLLTGYSNNDENILKMFDNSYENSKMIKGMKLTNDGSFYATANVLSTDDMNNLINKVDEKIDECIDNILTPKFDINPKRYEEKNISCKYCKYKDLCFMSEDDLIDIIPEEGDNNA